MRIIQAHNLVKHYQHGPNLVGFEHPASLGVAFLAKHFGRWPLETLAVPHWPVNQPAVVAELTDHPGPIDLTPEGNRAESLGHLFPQMLEVVRRQV